MSTARTIRDARVAAASAKMQELGWCPGEWESPETFDAEVGQMIDAADAVAGRTKFEKAAFDRAVKEEAQRLVRQIAEAVNAS